MEHHYVYRINDPVTGQYYIGRRTCNCEIQDDKYYGSYKWSPEQQVRIIKGVIIECPTRAVVCKREEHEIIKAIKIRKDPNCLNKQVYSPDTYGKTHTDEARKKMSEAATGETNPFYGKKHSEETRKKMSAANKKRCSDPEYRKRLSEAAKKHWTNPEARKKISEAKSIPVLQMNLDGNVIRGWKSAKAAGETLNIDKGSITKACQGKRKIAGKFRWKYN